MQLLIARINVHPDTHGKDIGRRRSAVGKKPDAAAIYVMSIRGPPTDQRLEVSLSVQLKNLLRGTLMPELSLYELEMERGELLPARETLQVIQGIGVNLALQFAPNIAVAVGGLGIFGHGGDATAAAVNLASNSIG